MPNGNGYPAAMTPFRWSDAGGPRAPGGPDPTLQTALAMLHEEPSGLSTAFFSADNVARINAELLRTIKAKTGFDISPQDTMPLLAVMRAMYLRYGLPGEPPARETRRLNVLVLKEIVPMVGSAMAMQLTYLRDSSTLPVPIPRPANQSLKGTRSLGTTWG